MLCDVVVGTCVGAQLLEQVLYLVRCPKYVSAGWDSRLAAAESVSDGEQLTWLDKHVLRLLTRGDERTW
jgi:hypothetical protein